MPKGQSNYKTLTEQKPAKVAVNVAATFPPKFEPFLTERSRHKVVWGGRGSGKTESIAKLLLLMGQQTPLRILCARETMKSLKYSSHQALASLLGVIGLTDYYTVEATVIYGPWLEVRDHLTGAIKRRRTEFLFAGLSDLTVDQIKSFHDVNICWIDEAQHIRERSLRILEPTIRRAQGSDPDLPNEIWFSFNPERIHDPVYQRFIVNKAPNALVIQMNWRDNPWFEESGLMDDMVAMRERNYQEYLHVYEGQLVQNIEGQVYRNELDAAGADGRIASVPYRTDAECFVTMDIGGGDDATAIWVWQPIGDMLHFIDYHEAVQSTVDYHLKWIESKPYVINKYWLPHDAAQRHAGMQHSYEQLIRMKGKKVQVVPSGANSVEEGINAVRTLFDRMQFDEKRCAKGLECLRNYRYELAGDEPGVFKSRPVHDKWSHGCDALRYSVMAYRTKSAAKLDTKKYYQPAGLLRNSQRSWMGL